MKQRSQPDRSKLKLPSANRIAVIERLKRRTTGAGSFSAPCIPALYEHYLTKLLKLFEIMDRPLTEVEVESFGKSLRTALEMGFGESPHARFILSYRPAESNPIALECMINVVTPTLEEQYQEWLSTTGSKSPFGVNPDARVMDIARTIAEPHQCNVLDVGAGSGRNSLPLARLGMQVDALEPVADLSAQIRAVAGQEQLHITVREDDVLLDSTPFQPEHYRLIVMSEVAPHFARAELRNVLSRLAKALLPEGTLLMNAFVAKSGYKPDALAEQAAQSVWSTFYTRQELTAISDGAGLELLSDELCTSYEKAHLPIDAWPPTTWYENWASGHNLFAAVAGAAPIELRWLEYRRCSS